MRGSGSCLNTGALGVLLGLLPPVLGFLWRLLAILNLQESCGGRWLLHLNSGTLADTLNGLEYGVNTIVPHSPVLDRVLPFELSRGFSIADSPSVVVFTLRLYSRSFGSSYP